MSDEIRKLEYVFKIFKISRKLKMFLFMIVTQFSDLVGIKLRRCLDFNVLLVWPPVSIFSMLKCLSKVELELQDLYKIIDASVNISKFFTRVISRD